VPAPHASLDGDAIMMVNLAEAVIRDNLGHNGGIPLQGYGAGLTIDDNPGIP
jgi:hypothetical protein